MPGVRPETATVLFSDVVGSTSWRAGIGDRAADLRMADLERASRDVVAAGGGVVVKSLGDGVMATFASAVSALDVAVALQEVARRLMIGGDDSTLRVGVSSGDMIREGDDWYGTAAIEASRLCAQAAGGEVLVADATVHLARGRSNHQLRRLGERVFRGFTMAIDVYELIRRNDIAALPPALAQAAAVPLIGRREELARGNALLGAVDAGRTETLFVVGEPGVGKTRLAAAVAAESAVRGITVLYGNCDEGLAAPYQPVVGALGPWLAGCPDAALGPLLGGGAAELVHLWPELELRLPRLRAPSVVDPATQRWRMFDAITDLVRVIAQERPLLVVVDDLQWAEASTLLLLAHLVRQSIPRTGLVVTVRRGETGADPTALLGDVGTGRAIDVLVLDGLGPDEVAEFVEMHVGDRPPEALFERLQRQTNGNPFFLAAVLAHLDEAASLHDGDGVWVTAAELEAAGVPTRVRDVIGRRLRLLSTATLGVLDVAAVAGHAFHVQTVRLVLGLSADAIVDAVDEAVTAGLIRYEGTGRFQFVHALVRHAVLDNMSRMRVARLHWRIAEELEREGSGDSNKTGEIAYHYAAGGELGDAGTIVRTALAAGDEALRRVAFEEAANHFRTALESLDRMGSEPDLRYRALTSLGQALNALADPDTARPLWLQAADIARQARRPDQLFAAVVGYSYILRITFEDEIGHLVDDVLDLLGPGDSTVRARALGWKAATIGAGQPFGSRMAVEAVEMARRTGDPHAIASTLHSQLWFESRGHDARAMLRVAEEISEMRRASGVETSDHTSSLERDFTRALLRLGRTREAERYLAIMRDEAERAGHRIHVNNALMLEAALATARGNCTEAKRLAAEAAQQGGRHNQIIELSYAAQILAARMEQGRLREVIADLRQFEGLGVGLPAWRVMLASALADAGHQAEASAELRRLIDDGMSALPHDSTTPLAVRYLPEVCRHVGEAGCAEALLDPVRRWAHQILVVTTGTSIEGASDRSIGHLLATLGRLDEADAAYTAAAGLERTAGFPPFVARTEYWHARALLDRDAMGDRQRSVALLRDVIDITRRLGMRRLAEQAIALRSAATG